MSSYFLFYAIVLRIKPMQCCHGEPPPTANRKLGLGFKVYITSKSKFGTSEISNQGHHPNILDIRITLYGQFAISLLSISLNINIVFVTMSSCLLFASAPMLFSFENW
jgi:hypothetical protein